MAKKLAEIAGTVIVSLLGPDTLEGNVTINDDGGLTVVSKKPRTSKLITRRFAAGQFITATAGEEGEVNFIGQIEVLSIDVADVNAVVAEDGILTITDTDGDVHVIDTRIPGLSVSVESEPQDAEAAPAKAKGKAKAEPEAAPAKGKGKGKAKEEAATEEPEAEEAPAKGKGKGKGKPAAEPEAAPAKGKGKDKAAKKGGKGDENWD